MKKIKKILVFHPALAPYRIDQFNLMNEIFDVEVVFLFKNQWTFTYNQEDLLNQCLFKVSYLLRGPRYKGRLLRFGVLKKIREVQPDLIISYEYSFTTQYLLLLKGTGLIKQPIASFIDDSIEICYNVQSSIRKKIRNFSINRLNFIIVMSDVVAKFYEEEFSFKRNFILISPILQLGERLRKDSDLIERYAQEYVEKYDLEDKKTLLFVGRFIPVKGLIPFIENMVDLLKKNNNVVLIFIGDGEEKEAISATIKLNNLQDRVLMPGKFESNELYAWYVLSSGFVLPSLYEPFGAVINEALIFGLKVLCSDKAGAATLITSENGVLFDPTNYNDTINKAQYFIDHLNPTKSIIKIRPPLIEDYRATFKKEWEKVYYE